jgi:2',3'-cyclic-nucleotide 2'-phosphodiesterase (5'-nucleotidase family)
MRHRKGDILLLDCGSAFSHSGRDLDFLARFTLKTMNRMGYDGMNVGYRDIRFLQDDLRKGSPIPFVSSNLKGDFPKLRPYFVREVQGIRVGVVGVLPPEDLGRLENPAGLAVEDPETALRGLLPELKRRADLVVLLSQLTRAETSELLRRIPEIDAAISCSREGDTSEGADHDACAAAGQGDEVGILSFRRNASGRPALVERKRIVTDDEIPGDEAMKEHIEKTLFYRQMERERKKNAEFYREMQETLKMSPEEFIRRERERNE